MLKRIALAACTVLLAGNLFPEVDVLRFAFLGPLVGALSRAFSHLVQTRCAGQGLSVVSPQDDALRGSQVCLARSEGAYAIVQALIARGVIGDFRAPDVLRFGFTPLYTTHTEVWDAVEHLRQVMETGEWRQARFQHRAAVT